MFRSISQRLTYANVTATLALFLALGGISWAATSLPRNSVGATQLRKNAVTGTKIKKSAVTSSKVKDGSLKAADLKKGTLLSGPTGPTGPAGPKGDTGAAGPSEAYTAVGRTAPEPDELAPVITSPQLPAGDYVVAARATCWATAPPRRSSAASRTTRRRASRPMPRGHPLSMTARALAEAGTIDLHCLRIGAGVPQVSEHHRHRVGADRSVAPAQPGRRMTSANA